MDESGDKTTKSDESPQKHTVGGAGCSPGQTGAFDGPFEGDKIVSAKAESPNDTDQSANEYADLVGKYGKIKPQHASVFLQRKLAKKCKYFDSGDYNMAKAQMENAKGSCEMKDPKLCTGQIIPTPESIPLHGDPPLHASTAHHCDVVLSTRPPMPYRSHALSDPVHKSDDDKMGTYDNNRRTQK